MSMRYLNKIFNWMGSDGMMHVILSSIIATVLSLVLPKWIAAIITLTIGIGKEVYDKVSKKGWAEWKDLVADCIGVLIGIL